MKGKALKIFYASSTVKHLLPVNFSDKDHHLFINDTTIKLPESGLFLLKNVFVTDLGIIYKNLVAIKENIACYDIDFRHYRFRYFLKSFLIFKKNKFKGGKALIAFDNYSGPKGFAHWICDGLTRLVELNSELNNYTLIVPWYFKNETIYSESLKLFNVGPIHYLSKNSLTHFKELYFPTNIGDTGNFHPDNVKKLRATVHSKLQLKKGSKNIYISRAKASRRFVQNENELIVLLSRYNFEVVYLEDYIFPKQVEIFYGAANIISIHGAALAMLMFANEHTSVLELRNGHDSINNMYYQLATQCGLNYYYLNCESIEISKTGNNFDLRVDLQALEETVVQMLTKKN